MADLVFGQQHAHTAPWFVDLYGQAHSVPVADFPHTRALAGEHGLYLEYLAVSWEYYGRENTDQTRRAQLERLLASQPGTVKTVVRPDGRRLIVDGNHRAAASFAAGVVPDFVDVPSDVWLRRATTNRQERYGSKPGRPYQSIFSGGKEWIVGRRRDTLIRHEAIGESDVLDLGCNLGAATLLAGGHGVDYSAKLITAAWRLAGFFASDATYEVADLNEQSFDGETVFCFAVIAHLARLDAIRKTLAQAKMVYFEENAGRRQLPKVADLFTDIVQIDGGERPLFRCR